MENALLIGLSRQMALERQLDVVANNIANMNTTGFKAERRAVRGISVAARPRGQFPRARPPRQLRAGPRHLSRSLGRARSSRPATRSTSPSTATRFLVVQTPARRTLHPQRLAADQHQGQLVTASGDQVLGDNGPIVFQPTDSEHQHRRRRHHHVREGTATGSTRCAASCGWSASPTRSSWRRRAPTSTPAAAGAAAQPDTKAQIRQGSIEKSNVNSVVEMTRMIEVTRAYTQLAAMLQQQGDLRKTAIEKLAEVPA